MDESTKNRLAEFMKETKPSPSGMLRRFREAIIELYLQGYSLKAVYSFVQQNGYSNEYSAFYRWVARNINFEEELARLKEAGAAYLKEPYGEVIAEGQAKDANKNKSG